jgi:thioester reductase-like protein
MANRVEMGKKSKQSDVIGHHTQKYGKMEGNELMGGRFILRMVGPHKFKKVDYFSSLSEANKAFYEWMEENK